MDNAAMLMKGMKVVARWFQANDPPSSLAGMNLKLAVTEHVVTGVVTHIRGDHPTAPTKVEVHIKPDDGSDEVRVKPESIVQILSGAPVLHDWLGEKHHESKVTNTTKLVEENPLYAIVGAMDDSARGRPQGSFIEDMEARGQRELVTQTTKLPTKGSDDPAWAKMGVLFGEVIQKDPIFRDVVLPVGWKLKPTDHSMWNELLDERGRVRGRMFYKAAFYDRSANIRPESRFGLHRENKDTNDYDSPRRDVAKDFATGEVLFATEWRVYTSEKYAEETAAHKQVEQWLDENRPEWKDAAAYWGWD